jgi:hypothetical protein
MTAGFGNKMDLQKVLSNKSWMSVLAPPVAQASAVISTPVSGVATEVAAYLSQPAGGRPVTSTQEFLAQRNGNRVQFAPVPRNISKVCCAS